MASKQDYHVIKILNDTNDHADVNTPFSKFKKGA